MAGKIDKYGLDRFVHRPVDRKDVQSILEHEKNRMDEIILLRQWLRDTNDSAWFASDGTRRHCGNCLYWRSHGEVGECYVDGVDERSTERDHHCSKWEAKNQDPVKSEDLL